MKYKLLTTLIGASTIVVGIAASHAQQPAVPSADQSMHTNMNHNTHMMQEPAQSEVTMVSTSPLTEPGNAIFATLQEVVNQLLQDDDTDWEKVDLESLRQHLIDMENFTVNVQVISQSDIEQGVQVLIEPSTTQAAGSLDRALSAHPAMLEQETGWRMVSEKSANNYRIQITSTNPEDVMKIRALGYIGIMTMGSHHQPHHWAMASGNNPHSGH
jgi:hypothetical protein